MNGGIGDKLQQSNADKSCVYDNDTLNAAWRSAGSDCQNERVRHCSELFDEGFTDHFIRQESAGSSSLQNR